jgi:16S rRNA (cytosine1402-N4)-methyltransferase
MDGLPEHGHEPVMVSEVMRLLGLEGEAPDEGARLSRRRILMDCTVGRGGHALRMAQALAASAQGGVLIGLDVDPDNLMYARQRITQALDTDGGGGGGKGLAGGKVELRTFHANFGEAGDVLDALELPAGEGLNGLLADFGVSTNQLLDDRHGLSFNAELPLDMRLDPRIRESAADIVASWDEAALAAIFRDYAQERFAWRIARKIVQTRASEPILTTGQLARLVRSVVPPARHKGGGQGIDPATRTFQALRMAVNNELDVIEDLLHAVPALMGNGGRAVFISFHSGEDRLVKTAVRGWEEAGLCTVLTKKPLEPGEEEMNRNPRSRSAKLRAVAWKASPAINSPDTRAAGRDVRGQAESLQDPGVHG